MARRSKPAKGRDVRGSEKCSVCHRRLVYRVVNDGKENRGFCVPCYKKRYDSPLPPALYLDFAARFSTASSEVLDMLCPESPLIRALACECFGHPVFDDSTLQCLNDWLKSRYGLAKDI